VAAPVGPVEVGPVAAAEDTPELELSLMPHDKRLLAIPAWSLMSSWPAKKVIDGIRVIS
jgi:hypothetical protein